jgi:hypothetical protein
MRKVRTSAYVMVILLCAGGIDLELCGNGNGSLFLGFAAFVLLMAVYLSHVPRWTRNNRTKFGPLIKVLCLFGVHEWNYNGRCFDCNSKPRR